MIESVDDASDRWNGVRENTAMLEVIIIALLVWLWVIERRINGLRESVHGLRAMNTGLDSKIATIQSELSGLLEPPTTDVFHPESGSPEAQRLA